MIPPTCPKCGSTMVRFVVGFPSDWEGMRRAVAAGEVVWKGTCLVGPDDPEWACARCHRRELEERVAELSGRERSDDSLDELLGPGGRERFERRLAEAIA